MTIQEKNPQRGQRGGGGRLTPVTSLQAAARGETGPSPQPPGPGHRGHHLSQRHLAPRCPVSPIRGGIVAHGTLQPPSMAGAAPATGETSCARSQPGSQQTSCYHGNYPPICPLGAISAKGSVVLTAAESSPCPQGGGAVLGEAEQKPSACSGTDCANAWLSAANAHSQHPSKISFGEQMTPPPPRHPRTPTPSPRQGRPRQPGCRGPPVPPLPFSSKGE